MNYSCLIFDLLATCGGVRLAKSQSYWFARDIRVSYF